MDRITGEVQAITDTMLITLSCICGEHNRCDMFIFEVDKGETKQITCSCPCHAQSDPIR